MVDASGWFWPWSSVTEDVSQNDIRLNENNLLNEKGANVIRNGARPKVTPKALRPPELVTYSGRRGAAFAQQFLPR